MLTEQVARSVYNPADEDEVSLTSAVVQDILSAMQARQDDELMASLLGEPQTPARWRRSRAFNPHAPHLYIGRFLAEALPFDVITAEVAQARREVLANFLETLAPDQFSITSWQAPRYGRAAYPCRAAIKIAHLRCCFGGWIEYLFTGQVTNSAYASDVGALISLDREQTLALFYPTDMFNMPHAYTQLCAAKVARHLASTGRVDWRVAGFSTSEGSL